MKLIALIRFVVKTVFLNFDPNDGPNDAGAAGAGAPNCHNKRGAVGEAGAEVATTRSGPMASAKMTRTVEPRRTNLSGRNAESDGPHEEDNEDELLGQ